MCGLVVIPDWGPMGSQENAYNFVKRALGKMEHRGWGERSSITQIGSATIGHVRLPIVDTSEDSDPPIYVGENSVFLVGEIFNWQELAPEARNDTEAMGIVYEREGLAGFHKFDGFWAGCIANEKECIIFNDYLSQKPLYVDKRAIFCSEPAIFYEDNYELNEVYLSNVLKWGYNPNGQMPVNHVIQLPAGQAYSVGRFGRKNQSYWSWQKVPGNEEGETLNQLLLEATHNRLGGDLEICLLLSGGLDSTIVYYLLKELGEKVIAYHTDNEEAHFLEHVDINPNDLVKLSLESVSLEEAVSAFQVPIDLGSVLPQLALAKALKLRGFNVTLSGDGADELFGGYRRAKEYDSQKSDTFIELPYYHLPRLDRIMMSQTIELRTPYLAPRVIKFAMDLPWEWRKEKEFLKKCFKGVVPDAILERKKHPLKTKAVIEGAYEYRQKLIDLWKGEFYDKRDFFL